MLQKVQIVTAATLVLTVVVLSFGVLTARQVMGLAKQPPPSYRVGDQMQALPGFDYSEHAFTVLLPVSPQCKTCDSVLAFYNRLARQMSRNDGTRLVWVVPASEEAGAAFVKSKGLPSGRILRVNPAVLRARALPSVIVVDRTGIVQRVWVGQRALESETSILSDLQGLTSHSSD